MVLSATGTGTMTERRKSPRVRFKRNRPGFFVTLIVKRFFFKDREILCELRDISEGGASLLINEKDRKHFSDASAGTGVRLLSENPDLSFRLMRKGRILRVVDPDGRLTVVVEFVRRSA
jgi:hypothetical protein